MESLTKPPANKSKNRSRYQIVENQKGKPNGVYYKDDDGQLIWLCSPLQITARTRDKNNQNWGFLLEWNDPEGIPHLWAMPSELLKGSGEAYRGILLYGGLDIAPDRKTRSLLSNYIQSGSTKDFARCTDKTGWHDTLFVLPHKVIGANNEKVFYQTSAGEANYFSERGTLEEWKNHVSALCCNNSRLIFSVSAAFASITLPKARIENGGFHFMGESSKGKSTALFAAASVFGDKNYLHRWRATINGLEGIASAHNHTLLILDEIAQVNAKDAGEIAYMLANGSGKHRANRHGTAQHASSWELLFLSSGEIDLQQHMQSEGKRAKAGQEIRLLSIPAFPEKGYGIFEELHGFKDGATLSKAFREHTQQYYGVASIAFINQLCLSSDSEFFDSTREDFIKNNLPANASGQVHRALERFALVAGSGELATHYGITGWNEGEAITATKKCFNAWIMERGGTGDQETSAILSQVRKFFEAHGESRFHSWGRVGDEARTVMNRAGVKRNNEDGSVTYYVLNETFKDEVCNGFSIKTVTTVLENNGILKRGKRGYPSSFERLQGIGLVTFYMLTPFPVE